MHSKLPAGIKFFPSATATLKGAAQDATELFPHNDGYGVYAGSCASNNPASWLPSYFEPPTASTATSSSIRATTSRTST